MDLLYCHLILWMEKGGSSSKKKDLNMSKRLWTETRQIGAKHFTQKLSKTKANLSQADPS